MSDILTPLTTFKRQFDFKAAIAHEENHTPLHQTAVVGMGGSAIAVSLLKMLFPEIPLTLHNSYGLPTNFDPSNTLLILNSYSGNTEEILDAFSRGLKSGAHMALLGRGGELLAKGDEFGIPYVKIPDNDLEPRFSIGYQLIGLLALMGEHDKIRELREKIDLVHMDTCEEEGKRLSVELNGKYLVLYSSAQFYPVAYLIKAAINEGAKLPCFVNSIPEANHNELQSFVSDKEDVHEDFAFLFIRSSLDHQRIGKRFDIMERLYKEKSFIVSTITKDSTNLTQVFETILTGYYLATYLALSKGVDPYKTPFIAKFKNEMQK